MPASHKESSPVRSEVADAAYTVTENGAIYVFLKTETQNQTGFLYEFVSIRDAQST